MFALPIAVNQTYANLVLLVAILLHNLTYPLSAAGGLWPALFYLFYASLFVYGTWALTDTRTARLLALISGLATLIAGLVNSYAPGSIAAVAVFLASIVYHGVMLVVLAIYTFRAKAILTEILLSATSLYLVIGSGFAAILSLIEWLAPGSFISSSGVTIGWQQMIYFSYVTLTTLGYGDITPIGFFAQAFVTFEAITGTLYTVILLSRLVGMHASRS